MCTQEGVHTHGNGGESAGLLRSTHTRGTHLSTNVERWTDEYLVELAGRFRAGLGSTCRGFARVAHTIARVHRLVPPLVRGRLASTVANIVTNWYKLYQISTFLF